MLRLGVIGAGHMGRRHAEKIAELAESGGGVELAGVSDVHPERARALGELLETRHTADGAELCSDLDAVVVAVPTTAHAKVVGAALRSGCDVLVEKPVAADVEQAEELIALAAERERVLQVGHIERYNAALRCVREHIRAPRFVEAHRLGPFPGRGTDIDVVRDMMIHDLEILQHLLGEEPERIEAIGIPVLSSQVDIANARVVFPGGCVANLTASRVSPSAMRKLRIFQRDGYLAIDFLAQDATVVRRSGDPPRIGAEPIDVRPGDALLAQLRGFVAAVRAREVSNGEAGSPLRSALLALRTALRVVDAMPPLEELS